MENETLEQRMINDLTEMYEREKEINGILISALVVVTTIMIGLMLFMGGK